MAASSTARVYAHRRRMKLGMESVQVDVPIGNKGAVTAFAGWLRSTWAEECREGKHGPDLQAAWTANQVDQ